MANIKELIQSIEAADSSFDEKLNAINQMEETLVAMRQQEEEAINDNVDLIVEAINVMQKKVDAQLVEIQGIIPEKGDKGDKGADGKQGKDGLDGKDGKDGLNGKDGVDGKDGVSVTDAKIDFDGSLVITLSTGQEINVGEVVAPELQEKIKLVTSGGAGTVLPSQTGNANKYLKTDGSALSWATTTSGTVTSVGGTGTVNGISLSGTVTTSGNLTLGGTLDLSSPPTIGNTAPNTVTATTLIGGGSSANYGQLTGGATTKAVEFQTLGSDSNIALVLDTKGTGAIDLAAGSSGVNISNGGTITAITVSNGASNYTSTPTVTISVPTTAGGVQATGSVNMQINSGTTIATGGTGYTNGDTITLVGGTFTTAATATVTASGGIVSAITIVGAGTYQVLPSNPSSVTGGSGSGLTLNANWTVRSVTIGTAGSGYVEQPTVTFSSGSATAYATVGSATVVRGIGTSLDFYTPSGVSAKVVDNAGVNNAWIEFQGGNSATSIAANGSGNPNMSFKVKSVSAGAYSFGTNNSIGNSQFQISHTASAVNYVQVTGATTASKVVAISAQGSDTDVTLSLSPKGAGTIRFGTYTAGVLTQTGYITITDSGGTSRRLLVG
jgi:hypothetical protein